MYVRDKFMSRVACDFHMFFCGPKNKYPLRTRVWHIARHDHQLIIHGTKTRYILRVEQAQ